VKLTLRTEEVSAEGAAHARRRWPTRRCLLACLTDADGTWGLGEAAPLPGYSPEGLPEVEQALSSLHLEALDEYLVQQSPREALAAVADLLPSSLPSARFALETAALDLMSRRRGCSAPALLGAEPGGTRTIAALLGPAASSQLGSNAERSFGEGYRAFKLKVGGPEGLALELAAAARLRARYGAAISLRLDANSALSAAELEREGDALRALALELFEEPGARLPAGVPLALDESLQGLDRGRAEALWTSRQASAVVLKPTTLGGLSHCWALAERARKAGIQAVISHCFEGPVAWRAAAALALALPPGSAHGLAPHAALSGWPSLPPLVAGGGALHGWSEPGLALPEELAPH
jgi:o-succinylbenzoate synthase